MAREFNTEGWSREELKQLADSIYKRLRINREIDLEQELAENYYRCKDAAGLAYEALEAGNATAGAAAVLTSATSALKELGRLQTDLYNAEKVKILEKTMVEVLQSHPDREALCRKFEELMQEFS